MTGVHLHLLVNHVPILGAVFALLLILLSRVYARDVLVRTGLGTLVAVMIAGWVSKLTGDPAEEAVRGLPGVTRAAIHAHSQAADQAFIVAVVAGLVSLFILWRSRREALPAFAFPTALVLSAAVSGIMAYVGLLGGAVRHTEVRSGATHADAFVVDSQRPRRAQ